MKWWTSFLLRHCIIILPTLKSIEVNDVGSFEKKAMNISYSTVHKFAIFDILKKKHVSGKTDDKSVLKYQLQLLEIQKCLS